MGWNKLLRKSALVLTIGMGTSAMAGGPLGTKNGMGAVTWQELSIGLDTLPYHENERLISSGLAVALGAFGAHRIYFGTKPHVAVIYGITFGGFGVLVLLDLAHILFNKDLSAYRGNDRIIMWGTPKERLIPQ